MSNNASSEAAKATRCRCSMSRARAHGGRSIWAAKLAGLDGFILITSELLPGYFNSKES
jgi:hypothetical protein